MKSLQLSVLACAVLAVAIPASADARPRREAVASIGAGATVDVSRLRALGLGQTADLIQATVARSLGEVPQAARGRLVVRITGFSMSSYAGSQGGGGSGGGEGGGGGGSNDNDYLEGEALIVGPGGEILDRHAQVVNLPASSGGAYYLPGSEQRRVVAISQAFAAWLRRSAS